MFMIVILDASLIAGGTPAIIKTPEPLPVIIDAQAVIQEVEALHPVDEERRERPSAYAMGAASGRSHTAGVCKRQRSARNRPGVVCRIGHVEGDCDHIRT
jgi:hypothetical protein